MKWIDVNDRLPTAKKLTRYNVKTITGSFEAVKGQTVILGKMTGTGFQFQTMDWQRVTHWCEWNDKSAEKIKNER